MPSILISFLTPGRGKVEIQRFWVILDRSKPSLDLFFLVVISSCSSPADGDDVLMIS